MQLEAALADVADLGTMTRSPVLEYLQDLLDEYAGLDEGEVATYIPELGRADPSWFGIAVVTTDGHLYEVGDTNHEFTIQSVSKPFVFGLALEDQGRDAVLERVGVEPSGNSFNAIVVDDRNRPYNPMVNAGAIVATGLIGARAGESTIDRITSSFSRYAGRDLRLDERVYQSESTSGDRNRAIAYLMHSFAMFEGDVAATIDAYFRQCSLLVTCRDLATMAATLANRGRNPITGEIALDDRYVENVLSVMSTCGMYDYAGEWVYTVGLPAKSGVTGGVIAVLPGQLGIGVFSPRLDARGNSARGIRVCQRMAHDFDLHPLRFQPEVRGVVRRSYRGAATRSNRVRTSAQDQTLTQHGDAIIVFALQGDLFFGSAERLFRTVTKELDGAKFVVLDCKHLGSVDQAAVTMLATMRDELEDAGRTLLLSDVGNSGALASMGAPTFDDTDAALEWCEDTLLEGVGDAGSSLMAHLADQELLQGLSPAQLGAVEHAIEVQIAPPGTVVFREGDRADAIYFVLSGLVSVRLPLAGARARRLATLGPGVAFGEMAFLDEGHRSADVVVEQESMLARLSLDDLRRVGDDFPGATEKFSVNLARNLATRLRRANEQVRLLAD